MSRTNNTSKPTEMDGLERLVADYITVSRDAIASDKKGNEELRATVKDFVNFAKIIFDPGFNR